MKPLVSVIVPLYNMESFIQETLESIITSAYPSYEVIVMNDGSTDNSLSVARLFAERHPEVPIQVLSQSNQGASVARNNAIKHAKGVYILPIDADDLITPEYIGMAVEVLEQQPEVLVVGCEIEMFGLKKKRISYPPFSLPRLARQNMIAAPSMFRYTDWERTGGYCAAVKGREDWDFWLSVFTNGGQFVRLPIVGIYYRVHSGSKRLRTQRYKRELIDILNQRHATFMERHLGGPLHYHRTWSKFLNLFRSVKQVGDFNQWTEGEIIYQKRNLLRCTQGVVVKQFATPNWLRGLWYGWFGKSKARRSYGYALQLEDLTPTPIAYREVRIFGILRESWYACSQSSCTHTFNELIGSPNFPNREQILSAIGRFTAELHKRHIIHQDYSGGNILFNEDGSRIEIIDLNRIRIRKTLGRRERLQNFERLNIDRKALTIMGTSYATAMQEEAEADTKFIIAHRWYKHKKQGITNL